MLGARRIARRRPQQCDGRSIERNGSRFARFRDWHQEGSLLPVNILPSGSSHLTAPRSGKQQEQDGFGGDLVLVRVDRAHEALGLLGGQKPLPVNLRSRAETCRRVRACARHVPLSRKIEDIAQEHQDAIAGPSSISLGPHVVDQSCDVLARNLVEVETTEGGEDVDAQGCFVGGPTPLAGLGMGQVAVTGELVERLSVGGEPGVGTRQGLGDLELAKATGLLERQCVGGPSWRSWRTASPIRPSRPPTAMPLTTVPGPIFSPTQSRPARRRCCPVADCAPARRRLTPLRQPKRSAKALFQRRVAYLINALAIRGVEDQSRVSRKLAQFAEPGLVPPPSFYGRPVDRLTRLPKTRGGDLANVAMRLQARVIPIETAGGDKPSNLRLRVRDQGLIVHLDEPISRQHLSPMGHHPVILPVVAHDVAPVRAEGKVCIKIGHEDGKSGVDRIAPTMDEGGVREDAMDEA